MAKLKLEFERNAQDIRIEIEKLETRTKSSIKELVALSRSVGELLVYMQRYDKFNSMTKEMTDIQNKLDKLQHQCREDEKMNNVDEDCKMHNQDGVGVTSICSVCHGRILWMSWEGMVRFRNIYNIVKVDQECSRCKEKITYCGPSDNSWICVGVHVEQLHKEHDLIRSECGPICSTCAGKEGVHRSFDSKNCVLIAYRYFSTGGLEFTRHHFPNGIPSTETQICQKMKSIAVNLFCFCNKLTHPVSKSLVGENSRLIPVGKAHCTQSNRDIDGEKLKIYLLFTSVTRSELTQLTEYQSVSFDFFIFLFFSFCLFYS